MAADIFFFSGLAHSADPDELGTKTSNLERTNSANPTTDHLEAFLKETIPPLGDEAQGHGQGEGQGNL
jgi:hypothetical protein